MTPTSCAGCGGGGAALSLQLPSARRRTLSTSRHRTADESRHRTADASRHRSADPGLTALAIAAVIDLKARVDRNGIAR